VLERYVANHDGEGALKQHTYQIRFVATLTEDGVGRLDASRL
jgi:hypothetical protein